MYAYGYGSGTVRVLANPTNTSTLLGSSSAISDAEDYLNASN